MRVLKDLTLATVYDSSEYNLVKDLQVPLLEHSTGYLRGVGFFASGWLRIASHGMTAFVENGGKARIILSPILDKKDWEAIQAGDEARSDQVLKSVLAARVQDLSTALEQDTLNALAWMVADEVIEFRFAVPRTMDYPGNYHDKVAVFKDANGDAVAIHGSLNDSIQGSLNGEAFSVFKSWESGQIPYLKKHESRLESLWNDHNSQFHVRRIPDAIREEIIQLRTTSARPYYLAKHIGTALVDSPSPRCPISLHPFQKTAILRWKESGFRGVFEMATGTGKTITSLAAAVDRFNEMGKVAIIILVPYLHLLGQWATNCKAFGFSPILCSSKHHDWQVAVKSRIQDLNLGTTSHLCILAVHATASLPKFQIAISRLKPDMTMLIGDEAHGLGSAQFRNALTPKALMRLGLSATPRRWFDEEGTKVIFDYFGKTCFEFSLEQAIGTYLTPYRYFPQLVSLTDDEATLYQDLTAQIVSLRAKVNEFDTEERIKRLLLRRAGIISSAEKKLPALLNILRSLIELNTRNSRETRDILVYCPPGHHRQVLKEVAGLGLRCREFVHDVDLVEREKILDQFAKGEIQVLVAIKCLDEGVDVPSTRIAFILASSTNPREFVQRRGRILRLVDGKKEALVYDYIVVPPTNCTSTRREADISVLRREMPRFAEFASCALNEFQARSSVRDILDGAGMLNLLDEKPWDVYHNLRQDDWGNDGLHPYRWTERVRRVRLGSTWLSYWGNDLSYSSGGR